MKIAVFSDIHANLTALETALFHAEQNYNNIKFINLGDCIDYGMRPNETINRLLSIQTRTLVNIKGNHERALLGYEKEKFSSKRGIDANNYTNSILDKASKHFISEMMDEFREIEIDGKKILCVHGDLSDIYWGKMCNDELLNVNYSKYDFVLSGHTHIPSLRNFINKEKTHKTVFINPGSIGQPRNLNPNCQYCVIDTLTSSVEFHSLNYDIQTEARLYKNEIDLYYRDRLYKGI